MNDLNLVDRARKTFCDVAMVSVDAGFPSAALMAGLGLMHAGSTLSRCCAPIPVLDRLAEPCMKYPPGRSPEEPWSWLYELRYQADIWDKPRRVILVVKQRAYALLLSRDSLVGQRMWFSFSV